MAVVRKKETHAEPSGAEISAMTPTTLAAELARADMYALPLNIENVAEYLGLEVIQELMDDDISGFLEFRRGKWVAGLNALHHVNRQRFTLAHEVAHFILHRNERSSFVDQTFTRRAGLADKVESEADKFAAELLMPEKDLRKMISSGTTDLSDLAHAFQVSTLAMRYRVKDLGFKVK